MCGAPPMTSACARAIAALMGTNMPTGNRPARKAACRRASRCAAVAWRSPSWPSKDRRMIEFKIIDAADQQFGAILNLRRVTLRLRYNPTADRWAFNLAIDDEPVLHGRRIVFGTDLLAAYDFGIGAIFAYPAT